MTRARRFRAGDSVIPGESSSAHWSAYWSAGALTSLPDDFKDNYDGEIARFWAGHFDAVPEAGAVLDLCTGNGAVALLAAEHFQRLGRQVGITAVDAARIDPSAMARSHPAVAGLVGQVRFIGERPVERLDLPPASFDLVTSQYGIEYCDWEPAAEQVARVLRPAGRLVMVCHCASPDILRRNQALERDYEQLAGIAVIPVIRRYLAGTLSYARFRKSLTAIREKALVIFRLSGSPTFRFVLFGLDRILGMDRATLGAHRPDLLRFIAYLEMGEARLRDLLRVNKAVLDEPDWYRVFETAGLALIERGDLMYKGNQLSGWFYVFGKPA